MRRAVAFALLALAAGCNGSAAQERVEIANPDFDSMLDDGTAWESSPWFSTMTAPRPWIEFAPGTTLVVHHTLGRTPWNVDLYLSANENGAGATPAAGNELITINDVNAMWIEVQNRVEPVADEPEGPFLRIALR